MVELEVPTVFQEITNLSLATLPLIEQPVAVVRPPSNAQTPAASFAAEKFEATGRVSSTVVVVAVVVGSTLKIPHQEVPFPW